MYDFVDQQNFNVAIIIDDSDECDVPPSDTLFIDANVILPPNTDPIISLSGILPSQIDLGNVIDVDVTVTDTDGDDVSLQLVGADFNPAFYGAQLEAVNGNSSVTSNFLWDLSCENNRILDRQEFELWFIADDDDKCKVKNIDTLKHVIQVNFPENDPPIFQSIETSQSLRVNEAVQIPISATDADGEEITIEFAPGFRQPPSASLVFNTVSGNGSVTGVIEWQPECSLFRFGQTSSNQDVVLQVSDNACPNPNVEILQLTFEVFDDAERRNSFIPPNVFTPNGDGKNDAFTLTGNPDINQNLPPDNCDNTFEYIVINNRAGTQVFRSDNRDFSWSGGQFPAGIYYYVIKYTNADFKGYIHLIR